MHLRIVLAACTPQSIREISLGIVEPVEPHETPQPYVPASRTLPEMTTKAVVLGVLFGLLFGASTVYLGLRAGLTVSASIPIAVLAISVLKRLGGSTILENNIVQTIGSAGGTGTSWKAPRVRVVKIPPTEVKRAGRPGNSRAYRLPFA